MPSRWRRRARGWFLEFRLIPVLLWSYTAASLGTALAFAETGTLDIGWFAIAMGIAILVQGWQTHAINEIYDWRSGTDRHGSPRALSGGSKVLLEESLTERDLWTIFAVSSSLIAVLAIAVGLFRASWLVILVAGGYAIGLAYTVPPIATSYRPYMGEWLGGFPGVLLAGLGAYAIQTLRISLTAAVALSAHALVCTAMLTMHHYLDVPADGSASPPKRTTVIAIGLRKARWYATGMALASAVLYGILAAMVHGGFVLGMLLTIPAVVDHFTVEPSDLRSVTRHELRIIQLGIGAGLSTAVVLAPVLWPVLPVAAAGYVVHLTTVAPPADLARAWRRKPRPADRRSE